MHIGIYGCRKIYELMSGGQWHHGNEIGDHCLPSKDWRRYMTYMHRKYGFTIEKRPAGCGQKFYRLVIPGKQVSIVVEAKPEVKSQKERPVFSSKKHKVVVEDWNRIGKTLKKPKPLPKPPEDRPLL